MSTMRGQSDVDVLMLKGHEEMDTAVALPWS